MDELRELEALQLDALREVANIGAGHAATALSQLTDRRIMISVPEITITGLENLAEVLGEPNEIVAAVLMHMLGDLTGRTLLMLEEQNARLLCDLLLKREPGVTGEFEELERSGLKEAGNILGGAYMNALSDFMGMMLLPSVPSLVIDVASAVVTTAHLSFGRDRDYVFCVETDFHFEEADRKLKGHFLLLPDVASLKAILEAIKFGR
jgi:chemotaxis protein CheC